MMYSNYSSLIGPLFNWTKISGEFLVACGIAARTLCKKSLDYKSAGLLSHSCTASESPFERDGGISGSISIQCINKLACTLQLHYCEEKIIYLKFLNIQ